jgi:hypothetical protein
MLVMAAMPSSGGTGRSSGVKQRSAVSTPVAPPPVFLGCSRPARAGPWAPNLKPDALDRVVGL